MGKQGNTQEILKLLGILKRFWTHLLKIKIHSIRMAIKFEWQNDDN